MKKVIFLKSIFLGAVFFSAILLISGSCKKSSDMNMTGTTGGTGGNGSGGPGPNSVFIQNMAFSPSTITITANWTITWTNKDAIAHTVTSDTGVFDSGTIPANGTYSHTFSTAGTYTYHCTIHPSMTASVVVNPVSTPGY
jgi:plastocyanin